MKRCSLLFGILLLVVCIQCADADEPEHIGLTFGEWSEAYYHGFAGLADGLPTGSVYTEDGESFSMLGYAFPAAVTLDNQGNVYMQFEAEDAFHATGGSSIGSLTCQVARSTNLIRFIAGGGADSLEIRITAIDTPGGNISGTLHGTGTVSVQSNTNGGEWFEIGEAIAINNGTFSLRRLENNHEGLLGK